MSKHIQELSFSRSTLFTFRVSRSDAKCKFMAVTHVCVCACVCLSAAAWQCMPTLLHSITLEERRNRQDIIEVFKMYRGNSSVALQELFETDTDSKGTRGHSCKLKKVRCTRDIARYFFE